MFWGQTAKLPELYQGGAQAA